MKVRDYVRQKIDEQRWPAFLKEWHKKQFRVTTKGGQTIEDIMVNVNVPSWVKTGCKCQELKRTCPRSAIVDGHVLMVGRDFQGEENKAMRVCSANVPRHTWRDVFRSWDSVRSQLPAAWRVTDNDQWKQVLFQCTRKPKSYGREQIQREMPTSGDVFGLRKRLKGMVIGPLDKNKGELWVACPKLYHRALKKAYANGAGYERIYPAKLSQYRKSRYSIDELPEQILRQGPPPEKQRGGEKDIVSPFARIYRKRGWEQYAKFNNKGGFNQPYILMKAKNVIDPETRQTKWIKVRPIAPGTKQPMRRPMHYVGRAWSFVTARIPGEHFVINKTSQVPKFLEEAQAIGKHGTMKMSIYDIESCYPSMEKGTIRSALRDILERLEERARTRRRMGAKVAGHANMLMEEQGKEHAKDPIRGDAGCHGFLTRFRNDTDAWWPDHATVGRDTDGRSTQSGDDNRSVRLDGV